MEIVIEYTLLDNFLIDAVLLILVHKTIKMSINKSGIILASLFGGGYALLSPLIQLSSISVLTKFLASFIIVFMSSFSFKKFIFRYILFILYTFLFGGMLIALFNFLNINIYDGINIGYVSSLPVGTILITGFVFFYCLVKILNSFLKNKFFVSNSCDILISANGKSKVVRSFIDTGNHLHNSFGKPVLVIPEQVLNKWFSNSERILLMLNKVDKLNLKNFETITVSNMGNSYKMSTFECKCEIKGSQKDIALGIACGKFKCGDCQGVVGSEILEV